MESERRARREELEEGRKEEREEDGIMIGFWNVAGLANKDREFWRRPEE